MKRFFISLAIVFFIGSAWAQQVTLSIDKLNSNNLKVGDSVVVNINIEKFYQTISSFQCFLEYDQNVLQFVKSKQVNDIVKSSWRENLTEYFYVGLFIDMTREGFNVSNDETLCQLSFVYLGGETDLIFGTENKIVNNAKTMGETKFTNRNNEAIELNLINGCVCK